jgi:predicted RNA binding protein YcfA (HicA-like mRNA interferase family)
MTSDYKSISWHKDAESYAQMYGLDKEDVEKIMISKSNPELDSRSRQVGHLIVRYRAGDVTVVVGHREKEHPVIMSVWLNTKKQRAGSQKLSGVSGSSMPKSMKELLKRVMADGFKVVHGGSHLRVEDSDGVMVCTLPSTPSEYRSIGNAWKAYCRKKVEYYKRKDEHAAGLEG